MRKKTQSIDSRVLARINGHGRGSVFVPRDFLDLGSREAVDLALHRLARKGTIRRLARGVYDFPKQHQVLGLLSPSAEDVARALAGRDRTRLQPAGAYAANLLGLSEQVPAKAIFLTDGPSRTIKIGATTIQFRRTTPRNMEAAGRLSGLLIQALRELGEERVTPERRERLRRALPADKRRELVKDLKLAPAWMHAIFRELAGEHALGSASPSLPSVTSAEPADAKMADHFIDTSDFVKARPAPGASLLSAAQQSWNLRLANFVDHRL
jgi:hypothetical protein